MKGPRELKSYVARYLRPYRGKKNGVIGSWAWDDLLIFKLERCRKNYKRQHFKQEYRREKLD